jgi:hypothetical protein
MELDFFSEIKLVRQDIDGLTNFLVTEFEGSTPLIPKCQSLDTILGQFLSRSIFTT